MFWRTKGGLVGCSQRMGLCGLLVICMIRWVTLLDALITPHSKALPANFFDMLLSFLPFAGAGVYLFRDTSITNFRTCFVIAFSSSALTCTIASVGRSINQNLRQIRYHFSSIPKTTVAKQPQPSSVQPIQIPPPLPRPRIPIPRVQIHPPPPPTAPREIVVKRRSQRPNILKRSP